MPRLPIPLALLIVGSCAISCNGRHDAAADETPSAGGIVIDAPGEARPYFHDFGELPWGEVAEHVFHLRNTEAAPVTLLDVQGTCACTSVSRLVARLVDETTVEGDPRKKDGMLVLPPRATAEMTLRVDSGKVAANQSKLEVLRMRTSSTITPYLTFEARLFPRLLFQATPRILDLQDVPRAAGRADVVRIITGVKGSPARVVGIAEQGRRVRATLEETYVLDEPQWLLTVTVPENEPLGPLSDRVVLSTTDAAGEGAEGTLAVDVSARVVHDVLVYPQQINLGALAADTAKTIEAEVRALVPGMRVTIRQARAEGASAASLGVSWTPVAPDDRGRSSSWKLAIEVRPGLPAGRVEATLVVELDDDQYPELRAPLLGYVR